MVDAYREVEPVVSAPAAVYSARYMDWPAIIVGTLVATATSFVLNTFGAAIGLSVVSPFGREGIGSAGILVAVALWITWVTVSSFMIGAYITGRMRHRSHDATEHESDIRDGVHGLAVWATGVLLGLVIAASGVGTTVKAGGQAAAAAAPAIGQAVERAGVSDYAIDRLFRRAPDAAPLGGLPTDSGGSVESRRQEVQAILGGSADGGTIGTADRDYLTGLVASETGMEPAAARARVDALADDYAAAVAEAKRAADVARKASVIAAFVLAASLLVAAAGAWWAAGLGGNHRDRQTVLVFFGRGR